MKPHNNTTLIIGPQQQKNHENSYVEIIEGQGVDKERKT